MNGGTPVCIDSCEVKRVNRHRHFFAILSAAGFLILILDNKTAFSGAVDGIELCLKTVIPALFPFFVLSSEFLRSMVPFSAVDRLFVFVFGLPRGAGSLAFPCFLGGYPVGAQCVYEAYAKGMLSKTEAEKLLAFCSNAGPAFLFGVIGQMFSNPWVPWALWGIHLTGARIAAYCFPCDNTCKHMDIRTRINEGSAISEAVMTMGTVCGWIILFRVLIAFLDRWFLWLLPPAVRVALLGILELSNGCCELPHIIDVNIRFILCSGMLAAGGLCVTAQTISVTRGLSLRYYVAGKLIQVFVSLILSGSLIFRSIFPLLLLTLPLLYRNSKKRGGNQRLAGV